MKTRIFRLQEVNGVKQLVLSYQMLGSEVIEPLYIAGEETVYYDAVEGFTYQSTVLDIIEQHGTFMIEMHEHMLCIPNPSFPSVQDPSSTSFRHELPQ